MHYKLQITRRKLENCQWRSGFEPPISQNLKTSICGQFWIEKRFCLSKEIVRNIDSFDFKQKNIFSWLRFFRYAKTIKEVAMLLYNSSLIHSFGPSPHSLSVTPAACSEGMFFVESCACIRFRSPDTCFWFMNMQLTVIHIGSSLDPRPSIHSTLKRLCVNCPFH